MPGIPIADCMVSTILRSALRSLSAWGTPCNTVNRSLWDWCNTQFNERCFDKQLDL